MIKSPSKKCPCPRAFAEPAKRATKKKGEKKKKNVHSS
jgi:hypothetical protein